MYAWAVIVAAGRGERLLSATGGVAMWNMGGAPLKVTVGGATMFVLDVAEFQKL